MEKEINQQEIEDKARKFLDEYRKLCAEYEMEIMPEIVKLAVVHKSYEA